MLRRRLAILRNSDKCSCFIGYPFHQFFEVSAISFLTSRRLLRKACSALVGELDKTIIRMPCGVRKRILICLPFSTLVDLPPSSAIIFSVSRIKPLVLIVASDRLRSVASALLRFYFCHFAFKIMHLRYFLRSEDVV